MILAEVILPLPVQSNYSYIVRPEQIPYALAGKRVLVPFGKSKIYTGVIKRVYQVEGYDDAPQLRDIQEITDEYPIIFDLQFRLFEWIAFYYMCTEGEVLKAALPIGLKPKSNLYVYLADEVSDIDELLHPDIEQTLFGVEKNYDRYDEREIMLLEALLNQNEMSEDAVGELWDTETPSPKLKKMQEKGLIRLKQKVIETYKPKTRSFIKVSPAYQTEAQMNVAFEALKRAHAQENLFMRLVSAHLKGELLPKSETLKALKTSDSVFKGLVEKGFAMEEQLELERLPILENSSPLREITLNEYQEQCYKEIKASFDENPTKPVLLHGVTGSGKTHVYTHLIKEYLQKGMQVLYLLPEISVTQQIIGRVKRELGSTVGVYHSRFNDNERVEIWHKVCTHQYNVVIGVRSAVFLPFENLGLIIVDEEHDRSFKQDEPAPRYNARDLAIWLSTVCKAPILLGSATPSFETYHNAITGKYTLVELKKRAIAAQLPEVKLVDMKEQTKKKLLKGIFSSDLYFAMKETLEKGEQVILFQNRRGYSPFLICTNCGHVPECVNCDISLTFHKHQNYAKCHYCGHTEELNLECPSCGNMTLKKQGAGTERIEEQVQELFPEFKVERMDLDTTRGKNKFQQLIQRLENKEIDVLVGTQMVSKGLDFENVTLVGIVNADNSLSYPDFRVYETAYQTLTQVSGRAGRSKRKGRVIIQTMQPNNQVLTSITQEYEKFYNLSIASREELRYPPFTRLIRLEMQHAEEAFIMQEGERLRSFLAPVFGDSLLGPDFMGIPRIRNIYRMQCLIKINKKASPQKIRQALIQVIEQYYHAAPTKTMRIFIDIDPY